MSTRCSGRKRPLCLLSSFCGPGTAHALTAGWSMLLPQAGILSFPCFLSARSSGKLCYRDLSILARPGGLWIPNCWSRTLLHTEALRTLHLHPCLCSEAVCFLGSNTTETHMHPPDQCVFLELGSGTARRGVGAGSFYGGRVRPSLGDLWSLTQGLLC